MQQNLFVNLNELKITKEFNTDYLSFYLSDDLMTQSIKEISSAFYIAKIRILKDDSEHIGILYDFNIGNGEGVATEEEARYFLSFVNILVGEVFDALDEKIRRDREYRLDVPEKLKNVKCSMSLLKRLVNNKTVRNVFNIRICYKDLIFYLCDEKNLIEKNDFVHTVDELNGIKEGAINA